MSYRQRRHKLTAVRLDGLDYSHQVVWVLENYSHEAMCQVVVDNPDFFLGSYRQTVVGTWHNRARFMKWISGKSFRGWTVGGRLA